jgi:large subunit ribosomal protein L19
MSNLIIEKLLAKTRRTDLPEFRPGDTVRVHVKIKEGDKERLQAFEGVVIKRDNGPQASFTVRKISFGQGVERIFPIHSKVIDKVDLLRSSKVRRAKLYYLRGLQPSGFSYRGWETKLVWSGPACLQYHKVSGQECPLHTSRSLKAEARSRS